ncbi:MAG: retroviral-like aspartic protease family protein [Nitrospiraceae bacterium]|nr:retroviral-like aspartic protease family protein [Nitrospiraceae bacterium]
MDVRRISPGSNPDAWRWCLLAGFALAGQSLAPAEVFSAGLYRCVDGMGQVVFTDRLAQMTQCVPLSVENPTASPLPASSAPTPPAPASTELSLATRLVPPEQLATSAEDGMAIPLRRIGQLYVVPVELNGMRTAHLIVDTGASHTILSQELVRDLALLPSDFRAGLVVLKTAGGSVDAQVVRIDSMKIATAEVRNSSAAVHTVPDFPAGVDGLLGLSFLHQFEVTLDTAKGELRLRRGQP